MAVSAFPSVEDTPDRTLLNVARLFTRLEYNLLSPGAELRTLRNSELQRMRVTKVSIYTGFQMSSYQFLQIISTITLHGYLNDTMLTIFLAECRLCAVPPLTT